MKKLEFLELYQQVEQMCGASQEQAKHMLNRIRKGLPLDYHRTRFKNGANIYRTIIVLETYIDHGANVETAWRPGIAAISYWNRRHKEFNVPPAQPLQECEIIYSVQKGEIA